MSVFSAVKDRRLACQSLRSYDCMPCVSCYVAQADYAINSVFHYIIEDE